VPFANSRLLKLDWLHVVDLGVAADYIGGLLWYLVTHKRVAGRTIKARISTLHHSLMAYYERQLPGEKTSRLPKLTRGVVKGKKAKRAKMRCGAGMLRHMVPWAMELAETFLDRRAGGDERAAVESSIHCGMATHSLTLTPLLQTCCCSTPAGSPRKRPPWKTPSPATFKVKPKMHLFLELCMQGGEPAKHWNYRDEDFGGSVAAFGRRRGQRRSMRAFSVACIAKFCGQPILRLRR
jgi:hypothetical protein